jgi:serine/threonine-protein kinase RsbW
MSDNADAMGAPGTGPGPTAALNATGAERFRFGVPARLQYRDAVRAFIDHICRQLVGRRYLTEKEAHGVVSAFVEAFNNAVIHAYDGHAAGPIEVAMSVDPRHLQVEVRDAGRTFVPEDVPEPDLDSLPEGGLGLFIIRSFMDDVRYERRGLQNVLMMRKRLDGAAEPPASEETTDADD